MIRRSPLRTFLALTAGLLLLGCEGLPVTPLSDHLPAAEAQQVVYPRLQGQVDFPGQRQTAATTGEIVSRATVSIVDASGQTVAATVTDTAGAFTLDVNGSFIPVSGAYYTVEAIKGLSSDVSAGNALRMRTILQWTGTAWNSCTGATVAISPTTTAVAIIKNTQSAVTFAETMGVVSGSTVTSGNGTLNANWQAVRNLVTDMLWRDVDPVGRIGLTGGIYSAVLDKVTLVQPNLSVGIFASTSVMLDGSLQLYGSLPRPNLDDEVRISTNLSAAGTVANDGTYLYVKPWDGTGSWTRIGTGYNGTTEGTNYGALGAATTLVDNAGCYGGYLYQPYYGDRSVLQRLNTSSGAVSTVSVPTSLIGRSTGQSDTGTSASYLASDGKYLYNGAMSINNGGYNGYTLRVYDPANSFALIRQIYLDGANTPLANTSYYTDGMVVDGVYLYCMEWDISGTGAATAARMRRYRLDDGQLETEYTFPQSNPDKDPLTGSYDWVNNKFWFGDYATGSIHRTEGRLFPDTGTWLSAPLDTGGAAPVYGRLTFNAVCVNGQSVRFRLRSAGDPAALASAPWYGPTGRGDYYALSGTPINPVHRERWVQIQATLSPDSTARANTTPRLYGVTVEAIP